METLKKFNLRKMHAHVEKVLVIDVVIPELRHKLLHNAYVLYSGDERIAVFHESRVYLLPHHNQNSTRIRHLHAFVQDFCRFVDDMHLRKMHHMAYEGIFDEDAPYCLADGIADPVPSSEMNCSGCISKKHCGDYCINCYRLSRF